MLWLLSLAGQQKARRRRQLAARGAAVSLLAATGKLLRAWRAACSSRLSYHWAAWLASERIATWVLQLRCLLLLLLPGLLLPALLVPRNGALHSRRLLHILLGRLLRLQGWLLWVLPLCLLCLACLLRLLPLQRAALLLFLPHTAGRASKAQHGREPRGGGAVRHNTPRRQLRRRHSMLCGAGRCSRERGICVKAGRLHGGWSMVRFRAASLEFARSRSVAKR